MSVQSEIDRLTDVKADLLSALAEQGLPTDTATMLAETPNLVRSLSRVTVDDALSTTSTNPVQNKVVAEALDGKAPSEHEHDAADVTSGTLPLGRGGTGQTTLAGILHAFQILNVDMGLTSSQKGCVLVYSNITYVPWYTDSTMTTLQFLEAMPAHSAVVCYANKKSLSDQPTTYMAFLFFKGTSTYYNLVFGKQANTQTLSLYGYSCTSSAGKWTQL